MGAIHKEGNEMEMKKTYRMQRGIIAYTTLAILTVIWIFFLKIYPMLIEKVTLFNLPPINSNLLLVPIVILVMSLFIGWSIRNKLWHGVPFALTYYNMIRRLRRHIKDARFEDEREYDNRLVRLPKIKIEFDCNRSRTTGKVLIKNSIKFDKKLENMRIDSALNDYVCERNYASNDKNWYKFEFYAVDSLKQTEFKIKDDYLAWIDETSDDYSLRLDE